MPLAYVGLGSNLGDRPGYLYAAIDKLHALPGTHVVRTSGLYESRAIDSPDGAPDYLNGVCEINTALAPMDLLRHLQAIEAQLGRLRPKGVHNAPRTLDLDLLTYGNLVVDSPELTLPHPRMTERQFVLTPLAELAPAWVHPVEKESAAQLRDTLKHRNMHVSPGEILWLYSEGSGRTYDGPLDPRGLTSFDRVAGGFGVAGCVVLSGIVGIIVLIGIVETLQWGNSGVPFIGLMLLAWIWIGTAGVVRTSIVAHRLDKLLKAGLIGEPGHGFQVEAKDDGVLDAEVVASDDEGLPDDQRTAGSPV